MTALLNADADACRNHDQAFVRRRVQITIASAGLVMASYLYAPYCHGGPILCPLRALFGLPCPSCGLTRAFCALAHLRLSEAMRYHALSPLIFAAVLLAPWVCLVEITTRRPISRRWLFSSRTAWVLASLLIGHHIVRLVQWASTGQLEREFAQSWLFTAARALGLAA